MPGPHGIDFNCASVRHQYHMLVQALSTMCQCMPSVSHASVRHHHIRTPYCMGITPGENGGCRDLKHWLLRVNYERIFMSMLPTRSKARGVEHTAKPTLELRQRCVPSVWHHTELRICICVPGVSVCACRACSQFQGCIPEPC